MAHHGTIEQVLLPGVREANHKWRRGRVEASGEQIFAVRLSGGNGLAVRDDIGVAAELLFLPNLTIDERNRSALVHRLDAAVADVLSATHGIASGKRLLDVIGG